MLTSSASAADRGSSRRPRIGVVLAAGLGKRMRSSVAKPLHEVAGKPMLAWVLEAARAARCERLLVVVAARAEALRRRFDAPDVEWVVQAEQRGTGHAVACAEPHVPTEATLLVLSGDVPLVTPRTLEALCAAAEGAWGALAVAELAEPGSLGRVLLRPDGGLERIVEAADAGPEERAVQRINAGLYALPAPELFGCLRGLASDNAQGELYLTDALGAAAAVGRVEPVELEDPSEAWGINDRRDLARVHRRFLERHAEALMHSGVTLLDPATTTVEPTAAVGHDTVLHGGVSLLGTTSVGEGATLHRGAWLRDAVLGDGVTVEPYSVLDGARVAAGSTVGPFARLRPGADLGEGVKVGNFVEIKNARLEPGVKAGHLAYLGDAAVGAGANIGAGVVTCNYDGERKHRTEIGEGAFVGSDTMLVAPVRVGAGATTAAGSTITHDVPPGALGVARARQRNVEGWAPRKAANAGSKKDDPERDDPKKDR